MARVGDSDQLDEEIEDEAWSHVGASMVIKSNWKQFCTHL